MKISIRHFFMASVIAGLPGLTTPVWAQSDAVRALYQSSAVVSTNMEGVKTFPAPPADFDPLKASDEALAAYGFPPRPDQAASPQSLAHWTRAMMSAKHRINGELKPHPEVHNGPALLANKGGSAQIPISATATQTGSYNWSGVANTNTLTKWNAKSSFGYVLSEFNVPVVQQSFGTCDGGYDLEVSWNGIDGAKDGDVLQGGSLSGAFCSNNKPSQTYYAWVEWYPSYPVLETFAVNPGDDIYVETYDTAGGCNPGFVFVEDETLLSYGTYQLNWETGPCLLGDSAEFIVERPGGSNGLYPLANYIEEFALSWSYTLKGTEVAPGATTPSTYIYSMVDDKDDQVISVPEVEGKYSLFLYDTGCAYTGGCTP
jgi:hypothetical protein